MTYKKDTLLRSQQTINENTRIFNLLDVTLREKPVVVITDEDIKRFLVEKYLPTKPPASEFIKMMQVLDQTMAFGLSKKYCTDNPMKYLNQADYLKHCNRSVKSNEEKAFSAEELTRLTADAMQDKSNPRALMLLLAKETGLRAGELPVLRKTDIRNGFIHVHCQQIRESDPEGHLRFIELQYTKNERHHPQNGRYVPVTEECSRVIQMAMQLPGESEYLFHDHGQMISKDSYEKNLKRRCKRLGIEVTNNHAFRMAFNSRLISLGFNASDRALILGHEVQTNEGYYSLTDNRRLQDIKRQLLGVPFQTENRHRLEQCRSYGPTM